MPILTVLLASAPDPSLARELADKLLDITEQALAKRRELTAVALQFVEPAHWFIGGQPLDPQRASAFVEIRVSAGTNTPAQMADFIARTHAALAALPGRLHEVSYVQVQEVPAAHWGWGGRSQAERATGVSPSFAPPTPLSTP